MRESSIRKLCGLTQQLQLNAIALTFRPLYIRSKNDREDAVTKISNGATRSFLQGAQKKAETYFHVLAAQLQFC